MGGAELVLYLELRRPTAGLPFQQFYSLGENSLGRTPASNLLRIIRNNGHYY